jgi:type IV secretion system protein VirB10
MNVQKEYPRAVVLRKEMMIAAIVVLIIVTCFIFYNMSKGREQRTATSQPQSVSQTASQADVNSIYAQSIKKARPLPPKAPAAANAGTANNVIAVAPATTLSADDQKAMASPISAQQINVAAPPATLAASSSGLPASGSASASLPTDDDQNKQAAKKAFLNESAQKTDDYLHAELQSPLSPYELQAGTIIPGVLISGINSDLPGQITGQVRSNVYDSISGKYLLVPQGAKLVGVYDSQVAYGQERVLIAWRRIIYPNGKSFDLEGMPGVDMSSYAGFNDQVNNHYFKIFGSVILMSILSAGGQLSQPQQTQSMYAPPTVGQTLAQSLGSNIANTGTMITAKNINIQPTLQIRQGYEFNISVTKDMVFPGAYAAG